MEDSPLISPFIKEYCGKFNMESVLNDIINEAMLSLPSDPFSFLCGKFKEKSQSIYKVINLEFGEKVDSNLEKKSTVDVTLSYQGTTCKILSYFIPYQKEAQEIILKNPNVLHEIFDRKFKNKIINFTIEQFLSLDKEILSAVNSSENGEEKIVAKCLGNALSVSIINSMYLIAHQEPIKFLSSKFSQFKLSNSTVPNLGFVLFKTGRDMNSKVKFEKWLLFLRNSSRMKYEELFEAVQKLFLSTKKFLTAGKSGENGMKLNGEGFYTPPSDSAADIMKLIENIIADSGLGDKAYYGVDCKANKYYNGEMKVYEMDGFKKPPDSDQLIEFYVKLCKDHPLIKYLEDPMSDEDLRGYSNLMEKMSEECPDVTLCVNNLISENVEKFGEIVDEKEEGGEEGKEKISTIHPKYRSRLINNDDRPEDIVFELTDREKRKKQQEEEERKRKEEEEAARILEEQRLKEEEEAKQNKGKKKPEAKKPEPPKKGNVKKTEEEMRKEKEEAEKMLPPPIPFKKLKHVAVHFGNCSCISHLGSLTQKAKMKDIEISLYDFDFETDQSFISDLGISLRVNQIILNGFHLKQNKLMKILEYIEKVELLYSDNDSEFD